MDSSEDLDGGGLEDFAKNVTEPLNIEVVSRTNTFSLVGDPGYVSINSTRRH